MNKSRPTRPRLVCSAVRGWESRVGAASGQTRLTARHLAGCAECEAFFAEDIGFEQLLRSDAARLRSVASPGMGFEQRILRAVRESGSESAREPRQELSPIWGRALLASASAALAVVLWSLRPEGVAPKAQVLAATEKATVTPLASPPVVVTAAIRGDWWKALESNRSNFAWAEKNPLEREMDSMRTDAQAVIGFLALNFFPAKPSAGTSPSQG